MARNVRRLRRERGYSRSELGRRAGPHLTSVWSDSAVLHVVTTIPQVAQVGTPGH